MARIKSFFGCSDLKTGGLVIGWLSLFANIIYLVLDIELVLVFSLEQSEEKKSIFGAFVNEINTSSPAFPIVLFGVVASIYGILASALLLCGVLCVSIFIVYFILLVLFKGQMHSWPLNPASSLTAYKINSILIKKLIFFMSTDEPQENFVVVDLRACGNFEHPCPLRLHPLRSYCLRQGVFLLLD